MGVYNITLEKGPEGGDLLRIGFGDPAQGDAIAAEADRLMAGLDSESQLSGSLVRVNGPASLAAAAVLSHWLSHRYATVAVYDPKIGSYIVVVSHGEAKVGDLLP